VGPKVLQKIRSPKPPTALFSLNNVATIQVLQTFQKENIHVPEDVAIVGFDDFELAPLLAVPLTAVRQPAAQLGQSATGILLDWIQRSPDSRSLHAHVVLPTELIIRRSCGCESIRRIRNDRNDDASRQKTETNNLSSLAS
jgi:LacI family transcriptional regulator